MKKIILYLIIGISFVSFAQTNGSSGKKEKVNIKNIVKNEASIAREKELRENKENAVINKTTVLDSEANYTLSTNVIVFIAASLFIILFFLWRGQLPQGRGLSSDLKKNINLLRQEKLVVEKTGRKKAKRIRLIADSAKNGTKEIALSPRAKEMGVSEGEVLLAARIKSYEMAKVCSTKY